MNLLVLLFDVRAGPVSAVPWAALILLLTVVFVLAVALVAGLVVFLIWHKRKKMKPAADSSGRLS